MNRALRVAWVAATAHRRPKVEMTETAVLPLRVLPNDIDLAVHMNNGIYFTMMDLGRIDLAARNGWWGPQRKARAFPVVMQETMTFRRSLGLWQAYDLHTRIAAWDTVSVFYEQEFVVNGEVYARGVVRMRFLQKGRGVDTPHLFDLLGVPPQPEHHLPAWVGEWTEGTRLPSPRRPAPTGESRFITAKPRQPVSTS